VTLTVPVWEWLALLVVLQGVLVLGYLAWLARHHGAAPGRASGPALWPHVDVIVPVRNEAGWIEAKLRNLRDLRYPPDRLRVFVVDGASTDGTADLVAAHAADDARIALVRFPAADKTAQLNAGLRRGDAPWVLVTDADARLAAETLELVVAAGESDPEVAVVGAPVSPAGPHPLEALHWRLGNYLRGRESRCGCASLVAGPCYAFRRALLEAWPEDVVADDLHTAFAAMAAARRVEVIGVAVTELRTPQGLGALVRHKFRRAHAYLGEVFRFLPRVTGMMPAARTVFLWRAAHLTVLPALMVLTAGVAVAALGETMTSPAGRLALGAAVGAMVVACSAWRRARQAASLCALAAVIAPTLVVALAALPLWRQRASFPKVASAPQPAARGAVR
jgi:hypothetical protein